MPSQATELGSGRTWTLGDKFEAKFPHHEGVKALWETKWKFPVDASRDWNDCGDDTHIS